MAGPPVRTAQDEAALAFAGLPAAAVQCEPAELELWPEHEMPARVFGAMSTQWRMGFAGPVGLDYGVLPVVERRVAVPRAGRAEVFAALQVMEAEALRWVAEQRSRGA